MPIMYAHTARVKSAKRSAAELKKDEQVEATGSATHELVNKLSAALVKYAKFAEKKYL